MNERLSTSAVIFNEEQLKSRTEYWQQILGLQDWTIRAKITRQDEMESEDCAGEVDVVFTKKMACIRLIDPCDYGKRIVAQDMDATLIHEMLHIIFWDIDGQVSEHSDKLIHQHIETIARALGSLNSTEKIIMNKKVINE